MRLVLLLLLFFNSFTALWGGYRLIVQPDGGALGMPLRFLEATPFRDYLIPGLILFVCNGVFSLVIAFWVLFKWRYDAWLTIFQGGILCIWLTVQILLIRDFSPPLHVTYYVVGIGLIVGGYVLGKMNRSL